MRTADNSPTFGHRFCRALAVAALLCGALGLTAACAAPTDPTAGVQRLQVCFAPDTVPVTVRGDSSAFVFDNCF